MKRRWKKWLALLLMTALVAGCTNASSYVKDSYQLVDVDGKGKASAKIYLVEGKTVPQTSQEIAAQETPKEISKEDTEQMFLVYGNRIINIQKDPSNTSNTLVEIDSIAYAKQNYDSSFLQGYFSAVLLQSLLGSDWSTNKKSTTYTGYGTSSKNTTSSSTTTQGTDRTNPSTSDRTGSFSSKGSDSSNSDTSKSSSGTVTTPPSTSTSTKSTTSSSTRKNDGSSPTVKSSTSKPKTTSRSGGFSTKRRR